MLLELGRSSFPKFIEKEVSIVVFWAPWCKPCKQMFPVVEKLSKELKVPVARVNVDTQRDIASDYVVINIPTFLFFKKGNEIERFVGIVPEEVLYNELKTRMEE